MNAPTLPPSPSAAALLKWRARYGRHDLPWQKRRTAYRVWVSEVMLQQTQVVSVIPRFNLFMQRFPDIQSLAQGSQDEVLSLWAGLGYYSRARNLHKAARAIMDEHGGKFPKERAALQNLPGIGRSTAAAIRAQAWDIADTILDGNVRRVLARVFAVAGWWGEAQVQKHLWALAEHCTPSGDAREYCQAIMDLGATVCRRRKPKCEDCPWQAKCQAYQSSRQEDFPTPAPARQVPCVHWRLPLIFDGEQKLLLERRLSTGIWGGLWSLPHWSVDIDVKEYCVERFDWDVESIQPLPEVRHRLTHRALILHPVILKIRNPTPEYAVSDSADLTCWRGLDEMDDLGLPRPLQVLLDGLKKRNL